MLNRAAPYFAVASAALVFLSWAFSNGLSNQEQATRARLNGVIQNVREYRRYRGLTSRLDLLVSDVQRLREPDEEKAILSEIETAVTRLGRESFDGREAMQLRESLHSLAAEVGAPPIVTFRLARADANTKSLRAKAETLLRDMALEARAPVAFRGSDAQWIATYRPSIDRLNQMRDAFTEIMNDYELTADILDVSTRKSLETLERRTRLATLLSALAFVVGTLLAIYGKTVEVRGQSSARAPS